MFPEKLNIRDYYVLKDIVALSEDVCRQGGAFDQKEKEKYLEISNRLVNYGYLIKHRLLYFQHSKLFREYKFFCQLLGRRPLPIKTLNHSGNPAHSNTTYGKRRQERTVSLTENLKLPALQQHKTTLKKSHSMPTVTQPYNINALTSAVSRESTVLEFSGDAATKYDNDLMDGLKDAFLHNVSIHVLLL